MSRNTNQRNPFGSEIEKKNRDLKDEIAKGELKLQEIADVRSMVHQIHEQLHNEAQFLWSPTLNGPVAENPTCQRLKSEDDHVSH